MTSNTKCNSVQKIMALILVILAIMFISVVNKAHAQTTTQPYVQSPYFQADSASYTFIAVSHPSLTGVASQIGLRVGVYFSEGNPTTAGANHLGVTSTTYGVKEYTISASQTQKFFIVSTNHATVNPDNFPTASFIQTTSGMSSGQVRIYPIATNPDVASVSGGISDGVRNMQSLSMWGGIVETSNNAFMAMEFIGDLQSSKQ